MSSRTCQHSRKISQNTSRIDSTNIVVSKDRGFRNVEKIEILGYSANLSYALGFLSVIASIAIWFTMGGTGNEVDAAAGERFGIFIGLWAPTFMAIGNGIDNLKDE